MNRYGWLAATLVLILAASLPAQTTQPIVNRYSTLPIPDGGRIVIDAPDFIDGGKPIRLIIYALPNGNSIEQTAGATTRPGGDWHFNIQNIAAQTALLRLVDPRRDYIVAYLESPKKSWPAWSADHPADAPQRARAIVASVEHIFALPGRTIELALVCHSGGGSFVTRYLLANDPLPAELDRIAYIDGYYGCDDEKHFFDKLHQWLLQNQTHQLSVTFYDDHAVVVNGKPLYPFGARGGTEQHARGMMAGLFFPPDMSHVVFEDDLTWRDEFISGRAQFVDVKNPKNEILHTRLVEWDGLLRAITVGDRSLPQTWVPLRKIRSYDAYQPAEPIRFPTTRSATTRQVESEIPVSSLPARPAAAPRGHAFMKGLAALPANQQQPAIAQQILAGNVPDRLRLWKTIHVEAAGAGGQSHFAEFCVLPDYLAIGSDEDFVRIPMLPSTAQQVADAFHCSLPTRKMVDDIYECADIQIDPQPMTERREAIQTFVSQNDLIELQLMDGTIAPATRPAALLLIAGTKKDIVITPRLTANPRRVAIYGWHTRDGRPIQPLTTVHKDTYVDYSHGVRLVDRTVLVDGKPMNIADVLADPVLCPLLSDEGAIADPRYSTQSFEPATRDVR